MAGAVPALPAVVYAISPLPVAPPIWAKLPMEAVALNLAPNYVITQAMDSLFLGRFYDGGQSKCTDIGS